MFNKYTEFCKKTKSNIPLTILDKKHNEPMIRVRRMLRPEDTNIKSPHHCDLNLVFYTEKENVVSAERIEGMYQISTIILLEIFCKLD